jgi:hypothetical protein
MDTSIKSGSPALARSGLAWLDLGRLDAANGNYRGLISFDLSSIPANASITSATLTLAREGSDNRTQPTTIGIYRPGNTWNNTATWNIRQTGTNWTSSGGDWFDLNNIAQGTTPYSEVTYPLNTASDANFDVKTLVQKYINGTYPNTGFFLKATETNSTYLAFHSMESLTAAKRPKLVINYTTGPTSPSAPQNLVSQSGDSTVTLSWSAPSSDGGSTITGYKIYRGIASGSTTYLATTANLTYTDSTVTNNTAYYYQLSANNSIGESPKSNEIVALPSVTSIQGTISNSSSVPIQGATVAAGSSSATTDANGFYVLAVPSGTYTITVTASKQGYASQSKSANVVTAQTTTVNFALSSVKTADLSSDGIVNSVDFGIMMSYWGNTSKPKADLNQDGTVNSVDFGIMMSGWG